MKWYEAPFQNPLSGFTCRTKSHKASLKEAILHLNKDKWPTLKRYSMKKGAPRENPCTTPHMTTMNTGDARSELESLTIEEQSTIQSILTLTLKDVRLLGLGKVISATLPPSKSAISASVPRANDSESGTAAREDRKRLATCETAKCA